MDVIEYIRRTRDFFVGRGNEALPANLQAAQSEVLRHRIQLTQVEAQLAPLEQHAKALFDGLQKIRGDIVAPPIPRPTGLKQQP